LQLRFYEKAIEWTRAGKRVAMISIVETVGSTPRKTGAKMLVTDKLELYGTIGGGCVEADVIFAAREVLRTLRPKLVKVDIKSKNAAELDMLCGGEATFFVEPILPDMQLLICGGGHISKALARVCEGLEFKIVVVDDRPQFANEERFPQAAQTASTPYEKLTEAVRVDAHTYCVVVTRGHSGDEVCLRQLIKTDAPFIAMVGSRAKWAALRRNLLEQGCTEEQISRVCTPAGLDIGSITPEEIAVSIAAQLIQERARRRSAQAEEPTKP
jgi:xanthine dehydrogenase accessory factor